MEPKHNYRNLQFIILTLYAIIYPFTSCILYNFDYICGSKEAIFYPKFTNFINILTLANVD